MNVGEIHLNQSVQVKLEECASPNEKLLVIGLAVGMVYIIILCSFPCSHIYIAVLIMNYWPRWTMSNFIRHEVDMVINQWDLPNAPKRFRSIICDQEGDTTFCVDDVSSCFMYLQIIFTFTKNSCYVNEK